MIGLIAHSSKADARTTLRKVVAALKARKAPCALEAATAALIGQSSDLNERDLAAKCGILVVMGGDGTILRVVHRLGSRLRPVFGINIGSLGFLTCVGPSEIERAVQSLTNRDYILSERTLVAAELLQGNQRRTFHGLNDVVIGRGERSELVRISLTIDSIPLTEYHADGLIIATPTGSTAYSLSAGGPVLVPESPCFVITPICPHVLTNRSTVVSDRSVIEVGVSEKGREVFLNIDGQEIAALRPGDRLRITKSRRKLPLAMLPGRHFADVLREKMKWSGSNI